MFNKHSLNYAETEWFDEMFELATEQRLDLDFGSGPGGLSVCQPSVRFCSAWGKWQGTTAPRGNLKTQKTTPKPGAIQQRKKS